MLIPFKNCADIITICHGVTPRKVLHIGAHTGEEAGAYLASGVQQVIWFEANDELIPRLQTHLNQFPLKQQIVPLALWNKNETLTFKVTNNFQSSSFFDLDTHAKHYPQIQVVNEKSVAAYRLDSLIGLQAPLLAFDDFEFVNIDTQGAELAILEGFGKHLQSSSLRGIYLEVNKEPLYKGIPLVDEIDRFLLPFGFHRITSSWTPAGWGDAFYLKAFERE